MLSQNQKESNTNIELYALKKRSMEAMSMY
jgi:hypothetical protein